MYSRSPHLPLWYATPSATGLQILNRVNMSALWHIVKERSKSCNWIYTTILQIFIQTSLSFIDLSGSTEWVVILISSLTSYTTHKNNWRLVEPSMGTLWCNKKKIFIYPFNFHTRLVVLYLLLIKCYSYALNICYNSSILLHTSKLYMIYIIYRGE